VWRISDVFPVWRGPKRKYDFLSRRACGSSVRGTHAPDAFIDDYHDK
jgi:hypothetical protein